MDDNTRVVSMVRVTKEQAELLNELKAIKFYGDDTRDELLYIFDTHRSRILKNFYITSTFFEAWFCGFTVYKDSDFILFE